MIRRTHLARKRTPPGLLALRTLSLLLLGSLAGRVSAQDDVHSSTSPTSAALRLPALDAVDEGPLPVSTPLHLTLNLALTAAQQADLDRLLASQTDPGSNEYRHWLSPEQFSARFGASNRTFTALRSWLETQGLSIDSIAPSRRRISVVGSALAAERAFHLDLRSVRTTAGDAFAPAEALSFPGALNGAVRSISGLSTLHQAASARIRVVSTNPQAEARARGAVQPSHADGATSVDSLEFLAALIDGNEAAVVTLASTACSSDLDSAEVDTYRALLEQAAAQGITVLSESACSVQLASAGFPASLSNALAFVEPSDSAQRKLMGDATGLDARPRWQAAPGLPADGFRREPDITTDSGTALATTVTQIVAQSGRMGNINGILYSLAKVPGLFTQADAAPTGTWEPASGLGLVDLAKLLKAFPRGINSTTTYLSASSCPPCSYTYGDTITLTGKVVPSSYGNANPSGTITFSDGGSVLGTAGIDNSGQATITTGVLSAGAHNIIATYSGDALYSGSASSPPIGAYFKIANATLSAVISPATNLPYGATATATATVTLPEPNAAPTGSVTAVINGVTGSQSSAVLSSNPGGNSATANILISAPKPGSYEVDISCQGDQNFQCQTPARLTLKTVKGYTNTSISVQPAAPQAGQPVSITATVVNSGNGTDTYTFSGSISFFDSGKLIATAPVATNQATTTTSLSGNRTHNITAVYTGDSFWNGSTSGAVAVSPTILPDTLTLSTNLTGTSSLSGVNIIFTGTVSSTIAYNSGPTGTVTFFDTFNGAVVQLGPPAALVANGTAASIGRFTTTGLQPGTHSIYVQYSGDDNYAPAISTVVQISLADFSINLTPTALTIAQGTSAQVSVLVGNSGGFNGTVSLGCVPPSGSESTCTFAPASVTGAGSTTLTIVTALPSSKTALNQLPRRVQPWGPASAAALAALVWLALPRRRFPSLLAILFASTLTGILGCGTGLSSGTSGGGGNSGGGGGGSATSDPGTPLGTQNFTITAAGSDGVNVVRHTMQYQVTVQ